MTEVMQSANGHAGHAASMLNSLGYGHDDAGNDEPPDGSGHGWRVPIIAIGGAENRNKR